MIEPYSLDLRERAVALLDEGATSPEVAEALGVSDSWVRKMRLRRDRLGHLLPSSPPGRERILSEAEEMGLCGLVFETPDATLEELVELVATHLKVHVSISTISRRLIELGLTRKKNSPRHRSRPTGDPARARAILASRSHPSRRTPDFHR
jgi:putative transposase